MPIIFGTHRPNQLREALGYQWLQSGVPGSIVPAAAQAGRVFTTQQQPDHPTPRAWAGIQGPNVASLPLVGRVFLRQEQPGHPPPSVGAGVQGPNVRPAIVDGIFLRQEQPNHPAPSARAGRQGPDVAPPPQVGAVRTVQEQPNHLQALLQPGIQGPDVAVPVTNRALLRQEQPGHPLPSVRSGVQGPNVAAPPQIGAVRTVQQQPGHLQALLFAGIQGPDVATPQGKAFTRQEQPFQAPSIAFAGTLARTATVTPQICAASSASAASYLLLVSAIRSAVDAQAVSRVTTIALAKRSAVSPQSTVRTLLVSIIKSASDDEASALSETISRQQLATTTTAQAVALIKAAAHIMSAASAEVVALLQVSARFRSLSLATSNMASRLNSIGIIRSASDAHAQALLRLTSIIRGGFEPLVGSTIARPAKLQSADAQQTQATSLLRQSAHIFSAITVQAAALKRIIGLTIAGVAQARSSGLLRLTSIISGAFHALVGGGTARPARLKSVDASDGQATSLLKQPGRFIVLGGAHVAALKKVVAVIRSVAWTQGVAAALSVVKLLATTTAPAASASAMRAILRAIAASSDSASHLIKSVGKSLATAVPSAVNSVHSIALSLPALVAQVATVLRQMRLFVALTQHANVALSAGRAFFQIASSLLLQAAVGLAKLGVKDVVVATETPSATAMTLGYPRIFSIVSRSIADFQTLLHRFLQLSRRRRVVRLPAEQLAVTLPPSRRRVVLPMSETLVMLPPSVRRVLLPREEEEMSDYQITHPEPAFFSPVDPTDITDVTFDWSVRGHPGDAIVFASVISIPTGLTMVGPAFIDGTAVTATIGPSSPPQLPATYRLRCMAVFASGRISNFSVPVIVKDL